MGSLIHLPKVRSGQPARSAVDSFFLRTTVGSDTVSENYERGHEEYNRGERYPDIRPHVAAPPPSAAHAERNILDCFARYLPLTTTHSSLLLAAQNQPSLLVERFGSGLLLLTKF